MKKLLIALLCLALSTGIAGCGKKDKEPVMKEPSVKVTEEAEADKEKKSQEQEEKESVAEVPVENETEAPAEEDTSSDRTEESDRTEIANNIRDIKELIAEELYDDAEMILEALKSRDLTEEEKKAVEELEKMLAEANK